MKIALAALSGFCLTLVVFGSGFAVAIALLSAEPASVRPLDTGTAGLWTVEPKLIERAGAREQATRADAEDHVDITTTSAIVAEARPRSEPPARPSLSADHVGWCSERYRSYNPDDNTYRPYSGGTRECVSPFSDGTPATNEAAVDHARGDAAPGGGLSPEHIRSCFERYRSYRPEDNTFQPYGGGPRRQCR